MRQLQRKCSFIMYWPNEMEVNQNAYQLEIKVPHSIEAMARNTRPLLTLVEDMKRDYMKD